MSISFVGPARLVAAALGLAVVSGATAPARHVPESKAQAPSCDASLWKHVYNPKRLTQLRSCVSATGIVRLSAADDDGDQHFLIELDPGQGALLDKRNMKKKGGALVAEIVCANEVKLKKVKHACKNYQNTIPLPAKGAHVRVTGTYVIDSHNGWAEIHPVSAVEILR